MAFAIMVCLNIHSMPLGQSLENGVSISLAKFRKQTIKDVVYSLRFDIPKLQTEAIAGEVTIRFRLDKVQDVVIDYVDKKNIISVSKDFKYENEHILIPASALKRGHNEITIAFRASDQPLNRRSDFLYTLLVPDRARTLFPCFDQPDMKALYNLKLSIPKGWTAVANGKEESCIAVDNDRQIYTFSQTEPLSTYLFSFVAGSFEKVSRSRGGREISLYHKETDPQKLAQCEDILDEVFKSLDWLEEYTSIPYPFAKYDLIILPGFQFGGMEHTGATLYNDKHIFLNANPTLNERLSRSSLIAHETAHMWFGDLVTMEWFSDVWTKEVFANYFASQICEPLFPEVNHRLNFLMSYAPSAYSEDRTEGSNPIQQNLDNLKNAGLVYGNIIYTKSPIMMQMLIDKIGKEDFRRGVRQYLKQYAYGNATWDKLIEILDAQSADDLSEWSRSWVYEKGLPVIDIEKAGNRILLKQSKPIRPQSITFIVDDNCLTVESKEEICYSQLLPDAKVIVPNSDGKSYGYFRMAPEIMIDALNSYETLDETARGALLINAYEAVMHNDLPAKDFLAYLTKYLAAEANPLLYGLQSGYIAGVYERFMRQPLASTEQVLYNLAMTDSSPDRRITALRSLIRVMDSAEMTANVYSLWHNPNVLATLGISDRDAMRISYELAVRMPEKADYIINLQLSRLSSPNLKQEYSFIAPSLSPQVAVRDSVFASLLIPENRRIEPWASISLAYLNNRHRSPEAIKYVRRGLEEVVQIQRTGDIFFPKSWVGALVGGHDRKEVKKIVDEFFNENPDYSPMLKNKILMNVYP